MHERRTQYVLASRRRVGQHRPGGRAPHVSIGSGLRRIAFRGVPTPRRSALHGGGGVARGAPPLRARAHQAGGGRQNRQGRARTRPGRLVLLSENAAARRGALIEDAGRGDVAVLGMRLVPRVFHASFSATSRAYVYRVSAPDLDIPCLDAMMGQLVGRRCFRAFARKTPRGQSTVRHLFEARVLGDGESTARFEFLGDRFLRRQVRVLVATALREMRSRAPSDVLLALSERGERAMTAPPADADGLCLMGVSYV